ncbi:glycosyltransferase [Thalassotalea maritima]|uniref:glycosyltransferase n=1 Tax=Thalassotalea maritima TaxID=3242416 RepID=UPI00352894F4
MKVIEIIKNRFLRKEPLSIYNLGWNGELDQPRVLVSYLSDGFLREFKDFNFVSNRKECQLIVSAFIKLGYCVDVVDCRASYNETTLKYDLIFGFGEYFRRSNLTHTGKRILYLTEAPPEISYSAELERCRYFYDRHKKKVGIERSHSYYVDNDIAISDFVICLGEMHKQSLNELYNCKADYLFPIGIPVAVEKKSFQPCKHILWFGSRGVIHKGLDLLIDAIEEYPDWTLHVCGAEYKDIHKLMRIPKNVKIYGRINVNSETFSKLINLCNYSFLLSCSEAVPTSVITTMKAGLIPVVGKNVGTIFEGSLIVDSIQPRDIGRLILSTYDNEENFIFECSNRISELANKTFSNENFIGKFLDIIKRIESET